MTCRSSYWGFLSLEEDYGSLLLPCSFIIDKMITQQPQGISRFGREMGLLATCINETDMGSWVIDPEYTK